MTLWLALLLAGCGGAEPAPRVTPRPVAVAPVAPVEVAPPADPGPPPIPELPAISRDGSTIAFAMDFVFDRQATPFAGPPFVAFIDVATATVRSLERVIEDGEIGPDDEENTRLLREGGYVHLEPLAELAQGSELSQGESEVLDVELRGGSELTPSASTRRGTLIEGFASIGLNARLADGSEWTHLTLEGQPPQHRRIPSHCGASFFADTITAYSAAPHEVLLVEQRYRSGSDECSPWRLTIVGADASGVVQAHAVDDTQIPQLLR